MLESESIGNYHWLLRK